MLAKFHKQKETPLRKSELEFHEVTAVVGVSTLITLCAIFLNSNWKPLNHEQATQSHNGFDARLTAKFTPKMTANFDVHFISRY